MVALKSNYSCSEMQPDVQENTREKVRLAKKKSVRMNQNYWVNLREVKYKYLNWSGARK